MDEKLAKAMDYALHGPRLFCENCRKSKVLSLCYSCHYLEGSKSKKNCRGCGSYSFCIREHEICKELEKQRLLLEINKINIEKWAIANFFNYQIKELPKEIWKLTDLQHLIISKNQIRELSAKIRQLANLKSLNIGHNNLIEIPAEIGQLSNLIALSLNHNLLRKLPKEIKQLTQLQHLILNNNQLTKLPTEIRQLTQLESLHLGENQISKKQIQKLKEALPNCAIYV